MDVQAYLDRIAYRGPRTPTLAALRALHRAHLYAVPFENLSIHAGEPITLNPERFFEKIVGRRRGGFCYELNGLFAELLKAIGFQVHLLSAQVRSSTGPAFGLEFGHLVLLVELDEPWLADVGFGRAFMDPLRLDERAVQEQPEGSYRITQDGDMLTYWRLDQTWLPEYRFTRTPRALQEFKEMCRYHQTSSASTFTRQWTITLPHPNGRETLTQDGDHARLISTGAGSRTERLIIGADNRQILLEELFGISLAPRRAGKRRSQA